MKHNFLFGFGASLAKLVLNTDFVWGRNIKQ